MRRRALLCLLATMGGCLRLEGPEDATATASSRTTTSTRTATATTVTSTSTAERTESTTETTTETTTEALPAEQEPGNRRWETRLRAPVETGLTQVDDGVLVGTADDRIRSFDPLGGSATWTASLPNDPSGDIVVGDGMAYATTPWETVALDASNGRRRWSAEQGARPTPLLENGTIYVPNADGVVHAIDADSGTVEWAFEANGRIPLSPVLVDGVLVVGGTTGSSERGWLYGLDPASGEARWQREFPDAPLANQSSLVALDQTAFLSVQGDRVLAVDPENGGTRWSRTHEDASPAVSLEVFDGRLLVLGELGERDPATGQWRWRLDDGRVRRLTAAGDRLVGFETRNEVVQVVDPSAGAVVREYGMDVSDFARDLVVFDDTLVVADGTYVRGIWHTEDT